MRPAMVSLAVADCVAVKEGIRAFLEKRPARFPGR